MNQIPGILECEIKELQNEILFEKIEEKATGEVTEETGWENMRNITRR